MALESMIPGGQQISKVFSLLSSLFSAFIRILKPVNEAAPAGGSNAFQDAALSLFSFWNDIMSGGNYTMPLESPEPEEDVLGDAAYNIASFLNDQLPSVGTANLTSGGLLNSTFADLTLNNATSLPGVF